MIVKLLQSVKEQAMAQVNISHFKDINPDEARRFSEAVRDIVALEVHQVKKMDVKPDTVSVIVNPISKEASLSGAATELQVFVSGNNWPKNKQGKPKSAPEAKIHFDMMANRVHAAITRTQKRKIYVWVTPFTASGWAE